MKPEYFNGGYITAITKPDPFALAAAGIALGLNESEFLEFVSKFSVPYSSDIPPAYIYKIMIEAAYDIKMKRKGD